MPSIFDYSNYRKFIADYYTERKSQNPSFSYLSFAIKAGFGNKGFIRNVIAGRKNLSGISIARLSRAMNLTQTEEGYFENLVFFNQAADLRDRNHFYERMNSIRIRGLPASKSRQVMKDQFEYYSKWYHSAIRSLIDMYPYKGDYRWLAKTVRPAIAATQARKSVQLLQKLGLIKKTKNGNFELTDKHITTGNEIADLAVLNFHKETAKLASAALDTKSREKNITGLTMGISEAMYGKVCKEIAECRSRIVKMVNEDKDSDRVYQLNFHLFALSNTNIKEEK